LDLQTRTAILRLRSEGHGAKKIAKALQISRNAVRRVLQSGEAGVPMREGDSGLTPHLQQIRELQNACKGNLVRVHEELESRGVEVAYATLTAFCRRHEIGSKPKQRVGRYPFEPGQEMQHDTSPHKVEVDGRTRHLQCASLVLCYSRMRFAQCFSRWNRFNARVFLTDAITYFGGAARDCMLDNSNVIVLHGTGPDAVMVPQMVSFGSHLGTTFKAHIIGDADRSAHVERGFHTIENNFYPGRNFTDLPDLNSQLLDWCDRRNAKWTRTLRASPRDLFAVEFGSLTPLPLYVPEVYDLHHRRVDPEGYVTLHTNRYSMPERSIGRQVTVHEHRDLVRVFEGHRLVVEHPKFANGTHKRLTLPEHKVKRKKSPSKPLPEELVLRPLSPGMSVLIDALRARHGGRAVKAIRHLNRIYRDYPTENVITVVDRALEFGLIDLHRIEQMILRHIGGEYFRLSSQHEDDHG